MIDLFRIITFTGNFPVVIIILLGFILAVYAYDWDETKVKYLVFSVTATSLIVYFLKYFIQAPRPMDGLVDVATSSFPSGHASIAFSLYLMIYLLYRRRLSGLWRLMLVMLVILLPISRLVLGVHFVIDVVVGSLIGFVSTYVFYDKYRRDKNHAKSQLLLNSGHIDLLKLS